MDTFQSELGTDFRVRHEGKHVVPRSNFLALNMTAGPSGGSFNAGRYHRSPVLETESLEIYLRHLNFITLQTETETETETETVVLWSYGLIKPHFR